MYLIQILLPRVGTNEVPVTDAEFAQTRAELVEAFDGVTAYLRSPAQVPGRHRTVGWSGTK